MKRKTALSIVIFVVLLLPLSLSGGDTGAETPVLGVLDIKTAQGVDESLSAPLAMVVMEEVSSGSLSVMSRAKMEEIFKNKGFDYSKCTGEDCPQKAAEILKVDFLVTGRLHRLGDSYLLILQLLDVEKGTIAAAARKTVSVNEEGKLVDAAAAAARELVEKYEGKPEAESGDKPESPEAQTETGDCPEGMVYVPKGHFCIDKFEYPNRKGRKPKSGVTFNEARALCKKAGKRLPTEAEFEAACKGPDDAKFGYGDKFRKGACNLSGSLVKSSVAPSGSMKKCACPYGAYDMVGNLWEWTDDGTGSRPVLKGGSYMSTLSAWVTCSERFVPQEQQGFGWGGGYDFGFRCAADAD